MPLLDKITLMPQDLQNIQELLMQKGYFGPIVIIDTHGSITIRDIDQQFLGEVKRSPQTEGA